MYMYVAYPCLHSCIPCTTPCTTLYMSLPWCFQALMGVLKIVYILIIYILFIDIPGGLPYMSMHASYIHVHVCTVS